jgi:hypothetical protein
MANGAIDQDSLYERDILAWSIEQATLLRARAGGNALDWDNLAEEIEDVGKSVYHGCASQVENIIAHAYKIEFLGGEAVRHWRGEVAAFRIAIERHLTTTIRNGLEDELERSHNRALRVMAAAEQLTGPALAAARDRRYSLEQILDPDWYPQPTLQEA